MFYLLSAVCMPVVEGFRALRNPSSGRWGLVLRQTALAVGIAAGLWVAGWLLALMLAGSPAAMAALHGAGLRGRLAPNVLGAATLGISLATLASVIVGVWVLKIVVHGWKPAKRPIAPRPVVVRVRQGEHAVRRVDAA
jgi:hypothetical protein